MESQIPFGFTGDYRYFEKNSSSILSLNGAFASNKV
jgi:hypothetical protein